MIVSFSLSLQEFWILYTFILKQTNIRFRQIPASTHQLYKPSKKRAIVSCGMAIIYNNVLIFILMATWSSHGNKITNSINNNNNPNVIVIM